MSSLYQQVQEAVSNCLPHLVTSPALEGEIPNIVNKLMKQLLTAEKYGERKVCINLPCWYYFKVVFVLLLISLL